MVGCTVKVEHEAELDRNEMHMFSWICGFNLKVNKKNTEVITGTGTSHIIS